jgi:hypothetical protein
MIGNGMPRSQSNNPRPMTCIPNLSLQVKRNNDLKAESFPEIEEQQGTETVYRSPRSPPFRSDLLQRTPGSRVMTDQTATRQNDVCLKGAHKAPTLGRDCLSTTQFRYRHFW